MNPADFWSPWEGQANSYRDVAKILDEIHAKWPNRLFAWRGTVNADWALDSSLYRRVLWGVGAANDAPTEEQLQAEEMKTLIEVHRWGLHHGRFAMLQHYGAPTRLIDVTFNAFIGLWFAVEKKWQNGRPIHEDSDARLFAVDVTSRLINEKRTHRHWEDSLHVPWRIKNLASKAAKKKAKESFRDWRTNTYAWQPPRIESRIAAQNGGFLLGGVPFSGGQANPIQWPRDTTAASGWWSINEVRRSTAVSLQRHKLPGMQGTVQTNAAYSVRIAAEAKEEIRIRLEKLFGYTHATIYPDFPGFASFGTPTMKTGP